MRFIEAGEIKALSRELQKAYLQKYERDAIRIKLDRIADERRFDGSIVTGENGADTDEALGLLRGHGELFVCESVIQNHGISSSHTEQYSYIQGLIMLGLPDEDIGKLADSFEKGELPIIKYFSSENTNIRGQLSVVPRIIVGADMTTVANLSYLHFHGKNKELAEHPIQFQIIEEIIGQLKAYKEYAEKRAEQVIKGGYDSTPYEKIIRVYANTLEIMQRILQNKQATTNDTGERDEVFRAIKNNLKSFETPRSFVAPKGITPDQHAQGKKIIDLSQFKK